MDFKMIGLHLLWVFVYDKHPFNQKIMDEDWKDVTGWAGKYQISNRGRLKSIGGKFSKSHPDGYITNGSIDVLGYRCITMRKPGTRFQCRVHTLVASLFLRKPRNGKTYWVNHKDGNKLNNDVGNLEWVLPKENCAHAVRTGLHDLKGEKHPMSKLCEQQVLKMREMRAFGMTYAEIGNTFEISRRHASDVVRGINWGWLK